MNTKATKGSKLPKTPIPEIFERRPFAVRALTVLLFVQAVAFFLIGFQTIDWNQPISQLVWLYAAQFAYLMMGLLNLIAAIGFMRLRPAAWLMAMLIQGLFLLLSLVEYVANRPVDYTFYGLMALSVIIVIYLNYAEVPALFLRWRTPERVSRQADLNTGYYENLSGRED